MNKHYALIVKTGEAEIRALEQTNVEVLECLFPIIELTRGRKLPSRKDSLKPTEQYPFDNRLQKIKEIFRGKEVCLDITSDESLMNLKINSLYNPNNGYENWINFLIDLKAENIFKEIIPCIIINSEDDQLEENLLLQVKSLKNHFSSIIYRSNIFDENCYIDLELLKDELQDVNLFIVIDSEYVVQAAQHAYSLKVEARIANLQKIINQSAKFIISATSFPNNISEIGNDSNDSFRLCEVEIFNHIMLSFNSPKHNDIIYSDYGSINPVRNDTISMARGWIPRIDVPLPNEIFYFRQRRPKGVSQYSTTYNAVARTVVNSSKFPRMLSENWGIQQIVNCSNGDSPASNPAFWISVRMCIHIEQQVRRLNLLDDIL